MAMPDGLLEGIDRLDPLPLTAQRLMETLSKDDVSIGKIADIVEYDQAVCDNVLHVANSSLYTGLSKLNSIEGALARLGTTAIMSMVFTGHLAKLCVDAPLYDLLENELWFHGALVSLAAGEIRARCRTTDIPAVTSLAALMHDIGKLIIVRYVKVDSKAVQELAESKDVPFVTAEEELVGCNHAEVGAAMARKWQFPEPITQAIAKHHEVPIKEPTPMVDTVQLANLVAKNLGVGLGAEGMNFKFDLSTTSRLGLDCADFAAICRQTCERMGAVREAYGIRERPARAA
jgi:putative nucleotidyltransferase with HDIG domain